MDVETMFGIYLSFSSFYLPSLWKLLITWFWSKRPHSKLSQLRR